MFFISSRSALGNEDAIGADEFWNIRIRRGMEVSRTQLDGFNDIRDELAGKRVLLLVHGYNKEFEDVVRAYGLVEEKVQRFLSSAYDAVVGYTWPGGDRPFEYFSAKLRAGAVAPRFCDNLRRLHSSAANRPASLDLMTHSMGARVVLEALRHLNRRNVIRNQYLLASAVDNESLEHSEEYFAANQTVRNCFVFHSRHDQVLGAAYRIAEFDRALGQHGPEDPADVVQHSPHTRVVNCKHRIRRHGDYKSEDALYKYISQNVDQARAGQFSTL